MKTINNFINEKLKISSKSNIYTCQPKDKYELRKILEERLAEDKNADLNDIDVSAIINMGLLRNDVYDELGLFEGLDPHNIDISLWNVSNVTVMAYMFDYCENFNCDLSKWDVSKVENMHHMFRNCENFTGKGLENWNVSKVENMEHMFDGCTKFNCDLNKWNVSNVEFMYEMFTGCKSLKNKPRWYRK